MPWSFDELNAWLALAGTGAAARARARLLLTRFGGPVEVFAAGQQRAERALGGSACAGLFRSLSTLSGAAEKLRRWLDASPRHHLITLADHRYPAALLHSPDPPLVLHAIGSPSSLDNPAVAIVGSRLATPAGLLTARRLAAELGQASVTVVSGLARGIDAAAHEGAMDRSENAPTIAVVACGLDEVYPRQHRLLFDRIGERGLIISEHTLSTPALPGHFPQRNRIIAGLASAVVVVEASLRSGSLVTARLALDAGRDVFAVPGPLSAPQSAGCNSLIKAGAGLLEGAQDVLDSLPWAFRGVRTSTDLNRSERQRRQESQRPCESTSPDPRPADEAGCVGRPAWRRIQALLAAKPCELEELVQTAREPAQAVMRSLLWAELDGLVARLPGGLYQWCAGPRTRP